MTTANLSLLYGVVLTDLLSRREERTPRYPTNLLKLDEYLWGFHPGELLVLGGRPSEGKTSLALFFALHLAKKDRVLFFTLEMSREELIRRIISQITKIPNKKIRRNALLESDFNRIRSFKQSVEGLDLVITERGRIAKEIQPEIDKHQPKIIIFDFLQRMKGGGSADRVSVLAEYINTFKDIAQSQRAILIVLSQINRAPLERGNKRPTMEDFKGSGAIEETADTLLVTHWEHKINKTKDKNRMELLILKQRHGDTGSVVVRFVPEFYWFEEGDYE